MSLKYVQFHKNSSSIYTKAVSSGSTIDKRVLLLLLLILLPCMLLVILFLYGLLTSKLLVDQEWRTNENAVFRFNRLIKKEEKSSCFIVENTFADAGLVPNTDNPNLVALILFLRFLIDIVLQSIPCVQKSITSDRPEETKTNLEWIERQLANQKNVLQAFHQRTNSPCEDDLYHKKEIKNSLSLLKEYFELFIQDNQNVLDLVENNELSAPNLERLLDNIIGRKDVNVYVVNTILDAINCIDHQSGTKFKTSLRNILAKILEGDGKQFDDNKYCLEFKKSAQFSTRKFVNQIQDKVLQTRLDEENVSDEMRRLIEGQPESDGKMLTNAIIQFLEDNYKTRKWLVIVGFNTDENPFDEKVEFDHSGRFHSVNLNKTFAAAISADRFDPQEFSHQTNILVNDFKFPIETVTNAKKVPMGFGLSLRAKEGVHDIHQHFNRHLTPSWEDGQLSVEFLSITTPCATAEKRKEDYVTVSASSGFIWKRITNQDDCANKQIIVVPKSMAELGDDTTSNKSLIPHGGSLLLRNEFGRAYLSVEDDSKEKGSYLVLDREWKNATGQRWRFVNNQLVNDHGKCLTAWTERSWYLYQYDCHPDWAGQIWIRHGLQIVNGFRFCLAFIQDVTNNSSRYVIQDVCDSTPPFLWYDWDFPCKSTAINSATKLPLDE